MQKPEISDPETGVTPARRKRRGRWLWRGLALLLLLFIGGGVLLAFPPDGRSWALPEWARARIEARFGEAMQGDLEVRRIGVVLDRSSLRPQVVFEEISLSEGGELRAALPEMEIELDARAALRAQARPARITLTRAGLRLSRDEDGNLDLTFAGASDSSAESPTAGDLSDSMADIDAIFAQPLFSRLESIRGEGLELVLEHVGTGDVLHIRDASLNIFPGNLGPSLRVGGGLEDQPGAALALSIDRNTAAARTDIRASFRQVPAREVAGVSEALAWLDLLDAPLSGEMNTALFDDLSVEHLLGELTIGAGRVRPGGGVAPIPLSGMWLAFDYDSEVGRLNLPELAIEAPALSLSLSGHADILDGPSYVAQLQMSQIRAAPEGIFAEPLTFAGGALDMRLQLDPVVSVQIGQAVLYDEGLHIGLSGRASAEEAGLSLAIDARIPELEARRVLPFWPLERIPNTRRWLERNMLAGRITNAHAGLRLDPEAERPQFALTFDFEEAEVRALRAMAPIQDGRGYLDFTGDVMTLALHQGHVTAPDGGALDLSGSVMRIPDTRLRQPPSEFALEIEGSIPSALSLIAAEPLNLLEQFPYDPTTAASGRAQLHTDLALELRREITPRDVTFAITGDLMDVRSDELVEGHLLSARSLQLEADPTSLSIGGSGALDQLIFDATWSRALGPEAPRDSQVVGSAVLSPEALAGFGVNLPNGFLTGQGRGEFSLDLAPNTAPRLSLSSDLTGIGLSLPPLGWSLGQAQEGVLEMQVTLGPEPAVPSMRLSGAGLDLNASISLEPGGGMRRLSAERLAIGNWLEATGALVGRGQGRPPGIEISGGRLDLRGLPQGGGGSAGAASGPISARFDRLQITQAIAIHDFTAELTTGGGLGGNFQGNVGGAAAITGTMVQTEDGGAFRIQSGDGGAVLRAAGLYPNAYGGDLDLILQPTPSPGSYRGQLSITGPRLRNAPAMAELLNAASVIGLLEQLSGSGINLGDVEARFHISPEAVTISQGTALGPSMGLSMDGTYQIANRSFDMAGVISPLYMVNGLLGGIFSPRREGLFGMAYTLRGSADAPQISVNPFSLLTPGVFREIFRRPPPELPE